MIVSDRIILTRRGLYVSEKTLEKVSIYPKTEVYILPFRTHEYRKSEPGVHFPIDLLATPVPPSMWPFVVRINLRLRNRPGAIAAASKFLMRENVNILFSEVTRSGHHHAAANILAEIVNLENAKLLEIFNELKKWEEARRTLYGPIYDIIYKDDEDKKGINLKGSVLDFLNHEVFPATTDSPNKGKKTKKSKPSLDFEFPKPWWWHALEAYELSVVKPPTNGTPVNQTSEPEALLLREAAKSLFKDLPDSAKLLSGNQFFSSLRTLLKRGDLVKNNAPKFLSPLNPFSNVSSNKSKGKTDDSYTEYTKSSLLYTVHKLIKLAHKKGSDKTEILQKIEESKNFKEFNNLLSKNPHIIKKPLSDSEVNLYLIRFVGLFFACTYSRGDEGHQIPIRKLLDDEIKRVRPNIARIRKDVASDNETSLKTAYNRIEDEMMPLKIILDVIISYKRVFCEQLKLSFIEDALKKVTNKSTLEVPETIPKSVYIYNIQYYEHVIKYPTFSNRSILNSLHNNSNARQQMLNVIEGLRKLPADRRKIRDADRRIDLDPVLISPVESFCHAYYHLAYEREFKTVAQSDKGLIPFPEDSDYPKSIIHRILPQEDSATIGITSVNTDSLTLRLCPLNTPSLRRFTEVELTRYTRQTSDLAQPEPDKPSTSIGLLNAFCEAMANQNALMDTSYEELNVWHLYNRMYSVGQDHEYGSIKALAQATALNFNGFPDDIDSQLQNSLLHKINNNPACDGELEHDISKSTQNSSTDADEKKKKRGDIGQHKSRQKIVIGPVKTAKLSGGRVFVSMSLEHPMRTKWLKSIQEIGGKLGFQAFAVETFTQQVTPLVGDHIRNSHAMIQVLSLPLPTKSDHAAQQRIQNTNSRIWLSAEYLTAVTNGLQVIRLVDECSIDQRQLDVGRDHPCLNFSIVEPFDKFEKRVEEAFLHLRQILGNTLGG